jgi:imidazolonepropionase-like amidohydrolase
VPVEDSVVIVEGDRVAAAGPGARIAIPPGAQILEARGMALLPGL